jgi:hypothetical protein
MGFSPLYQRLQRLTRLKTVLVRDFPLMVLGSYLGPSFVMLGVSDDVKIFGAVISLSFQSSLLVWVERSMGRSGRLEGDTSIGTICALPLREASGLL